MLKPLVDDRKYRAIKLRNNLDVLLIEDPSVIKNAASLSVGTGSFEDPEDAPGLSHLTEHLIMLGSNKFPGPSEFEDHLAEYYGSINTFTEEEKTTFYFEVNAEGFDTALYMFSRLFAEPLLDMDEIKSQINKMKEEHFKNINKDQWREHQIIKTLANPTHPFRTSGLGSHDKLNKMDVEYLSQLVKMFYNKNYTPHNMKLVITCKINI
jgi:insulysin